MSIAFCNSRCPLQLLVRMVYVRIELSGKGKKMEGAKFQKCFFIFVLRRFSGIFPLIQLLQHESELMLQIDLLAWVGW